MCLTDGREYTISGERLVFGRDASCDVVVGGTEVSRRHAEIERISEGYVLNDFSVNGTYVNGERVGRQHLLARADVIRIGHDEFRFYADVASPPTPRRAPERPPQVTAPHPPTGAGARLSDTMHGLPPSALSAAATPTQPQVAPLASLLVRSGALKGRRLPVKVPIVNIGRAEFNDVVIADPSVSTSHAKLQRRDDVWVLTDLGSTNGTFVEGERLSGEVALGPGTTVKFGEVAVLFEPLDETVPIRRSSGTQVVSAVLPSGGGTGRTSAAADPAVTDPRPDPAAVDAPIAADPRVDAPRQRAAGLAHHRPRAGRRGGGLLHPALTRGPVHFTCAARTDIGIVRSGNEDNYLMLARPRACSSSRTGWAGTPPARWRARWRCGSRRTQIGTLRGLSDEQAGDRVSDAPSAPPTTRSSSGRSRSTTSAGWGPRPRCWC